MKRIFKALLQAVVEIAWEAWRTYRLKRRVTDAKGAADAPLPSDDPRLRDSPFRRD